MPTVGESLMEPCARNLGGAAWSSDPGLASVHRYRGPEEQRRAQFWASVQRLLAGAQWPSEAERVNSAINREYFFAGRTRGNYLNHTCIVPVNYRVKK